MVVSLVCCLVSSASVSGVLGVLGVSQGQGGRGQFVGRWAVGQGERLWFGEDCAGVDCGEVWNAPGRAVDARRVGGTGDTWSSGTLEGGARGQVARSKRGSGARRVAYVMAWASAWTAGAAGRMRTQTRPVWGRAAAHAWPRVRGSDRPFCAVAPARSTVFRDRLGQLVQLQCQNGLL